MRVEVLPLWLICACLRGGWRSLCAGFRPPTPKAAACQDRRTLPRTRAQIPRAAQRGIIPNLYFVLCTLYIQNSSGLTPHLFSPHTRIVYAAGWYRGVPSPSAKRQNS